MLTWWFFLLCFPSPLTLTFPVMNIKDLKDFLSVINDGQYQDADSPELDELQTRWSRSGKFEGDILLSDVQKKTLIANALGNRNADIRVGRIWPNGVVPYDINYTAFNYDEVSIIWDNIAVFMRISCIKFKPRTTEEDYVLFTGLPDGCYADTGVKGGVQIVNYGIGCMGAGVVQHEILHALGIWHMHSTFNRDDYVKIVWDKIKPNGFFNFWKFDSTEVSNLGVEYDYDSVMHYAAWDYSIDGNQTIYVLKPTKFIIGQRRGMSSGDMLKLNRLYKCHKK